MRLNWMISNGSIVTVNDIQNACTEFFKQNRVVPDTVKLTIQDYTGFIHNIFIAAVQTLERGKEYGLFVAVPGGYVELLLLEEDGESTANMAGFSIMVIESTKVDREFEKIILNKEDQ